ncbi:Aldehyde dehydrogenase family 8 member A1 [Araneus ventricosus]|uniref:Aldehyde dehydrogenase family 8 member A1 n=1 Tax=Araneus ventricosus TaxID=182803 RepID=A0A4Y2IJK0_ARAVE|nr:Aldehyde dehydrogenase family 8 member A1 [Araneus ventricosus]
MGGKNAAIVFSDADLNNCIPALIRGSFINQGQICLSTSRIYVERKLFSTFAERFVTEAKKIKMGDPLEDETWLGPVCSKPHYERIKQYLKIAKEEGATFLCGSENLNLPDNNRKVGTVWCNCWLVRNLHMPFGGEKRSGLGREGTEDSRDFYTYKKTICIKYKLP